MNMPNLPQVLTPEEIADYLKIDRSIVIKELEEGRLRGFKIGQEWRCTDTSLLEYISRNHTIIISSLADSSKLGFEATGFTEIGPFHYQWPKNKEHFESGYETTRNINGRTHTFKIGFTNREAAGLLRRRVVMWIDNWPLVEFAGGNNYDSDGLLAGIIKVQGGKQLRPSARIPEEYRNFNVARYDSIIQGPYASRNMAVIVLKDDLETMLHHAIVRAQWKELI
jgi:excisionase family DNA binding protein